MGADILHEKNQEQLRKKDEQYCTQMEEKQQLELMLRSKEMELKTLTNHLKQVWLNQNVFFLIYENKHVHVFQSSTFQININTPFKTS